MKLIITGGTGLLGKKVNSILSHYPEIEKINIVRRQPIAAGELYWDFCSPLPEDLAFDAILHMASSIDYNNPSVLSDNTIPALYIFNAAKKNNAKIYFTSTASVHGSHQPWASNVPVIPNDDYALSKLFCERIFQSLSLDICIFRLNGIYGFQKSTHLGINNAIFQALVYKKKPQLNGSGNGLRNYISDVDAARWIVYEILQNERISKIIYMAGKETLAIKVWLKTIAKKFLGDCSLERFPGNSDNDVIVTPSPCPIQQQQLADYLDSLRNEHENMLFF